MKTEDFQKKKQQSLPEMNCGYIVSVSNRGFQEHNKISLAKK